MTTSAFGIDHGVSKAVIAGVGRATSSLSPQARKVLRARLMDARLARTTGGSEGRAMPTSIGQKKIEALKADYRVSGTRTRQYDKPKGFLARLRHKKPKDTAYPNVKYVSGGGRQNKNPRAKDKALAEHPFTSGRKTKRDVVVHVENPDKGHLWWKKKKDFKDKAGWMTPKPDSQGAMHMHVVRNNEDTHMMGHVGRHEVNHINPDVTGKSALRNPWRQNLFNLRKSPKTSWAAEEGRAEGMARRGSPGDQNDNRYLGYPRGFRGKQQEAYHRSFKGSAGREAERFNGPPTSSPYKKKADTLTATIRGANQKQYQRYKDSETFKTPGSRHPWNAFKTRTYRPPGQLPRRTAEQQLVAPEIRTNLSSLETANKWNNKPLGAPRVGSSVPTAPKTGAPRHAKPGFLRRAGEKLGV